MQANVKSANAYPLVKHYIGQLGLVSIFKAHIKRGGAYIDPAESLCIMITNILLSSKPLYQIEEWLADYADYQGEEPVSANHFNDDRLARDLDKLFAAPRQEMMTEISLNAIETYELETNCIHNDSTTITFSGEYRNQASDTVQLVPGYNKDHRPDLKQIVFGLNITEDGHVPIDHQLFDGNRTDDTTHIENWKRLRDLLKKEDFVYIADSKLSTKKNLTAIDNWKGKFISILPKTRKEVTEFYEQLRISLPDLEPAYEKESSRKKGEFTVYRIFDNSQTQEGFRLIWVHSSTK
ncbi:MAG: IS1634 family transposase [SAR324 cluster bacterium]|nr:IS1634 family transposase [SAR324 cluster bacterium]